MNTISQAHEFALYSPAELDVSKMALGSIVLNEPDIIRRLVHILRVQPEQKITLFDKKHHATILIKHVVAKKEVEAEVLGVHKNELLLPRIHWILPLLERDDFEQALSGLTVLGATSIQPLVTRKVHRPKLLLKEPERLERVMISAAEQSKQFVLPTIKPIIPIESLANTRNSRSHKVFFDPGGMPSLEMIKALQNEPEEDITCMVGPEGDLTADEKASLKKLGFSFFALTPTILRSKDAVFLATGLLRCIF